MPDATAPTPSPQPAPSKFKTFLRRLASSVVLWSLVLTAMFSANRSLSDSVFLVIMVILALTGLAEFYGMVEKRGLTCFKGWGILGGLLLMVGTFLNLTGRIGTSGSPARVNDFETSFIILFVLGLCLRQFFSHSSAPGLVSISTTLFGLMYVPWLLNFMQKINFFPGVDGHYYLLYFIPITWPQPRLVGWPILHHITDDRRALGVTHRPSHSPNHHRKNQSQEKTEQRPRERHNDFIERRDRRQDLTRTFPLPLDSFHRRHLRQGNVTPRRDAAQDVLHSFDTRFPNRLAKPNRKPVDLESPPPRSEEVPQLMNEDE